MIVTEHLRERISLYVGMPARIGQKSQGTLVIAWSLPR